MKAITVRASGSSAAEVDRPAEPNVSPGKGGRLMAAQPLKLNWKPLPLPTDALDTRQATLHEFTAQARLAFDGAQGVYSYLIWRTHRVGAVATLSGFGSRLAAQRAAETAIAALLGWRASVNETVMATGRRRSSAGSAGKVEPPITPEACGRRTAPAGLLDPGHRTGGHASERATNHRP